MATITDFLLSVNKISLIAFLVVLGFLIYEVYLLRKEQLKKQKPVLPHFDNNVVINKSSMPAQVIPASSKNTPSPLKKKTKSFPILAVVLFIMLIFFLTISVYFMVLGQNQNKVPVAEPKVIIQEVSSPGLKIFTSNWVEVKEGSSTAKLIKPGTKLYIGIQTINGADIDRARIRVNETNWNVDHITSLFNSDKKMYYKEYIVATGESKLKVDAQLHSQADGWLGD